MVERYIKAIAQGQGFFILSRGWVVHAKVIFNENLEFFVTLLVHVDYIYLFLLYY